MSFSRPTLAELRSRISSDISARLLDGSPLKPRSVLGVMAYVWAGACHMMYGALSWYFRQFWVKTAEKVWLEQKASIWGITRKNGAAASGSVLLEGAGLVPAGTALRSSGGVFFAVRSDATAPGPAQIKATEHGSSGNLAPGTVLSFVSPVDGVQSAAVVVSLSGGADIETDDDLRARTLSALQSPPHGGSRADYVNWALDISGVTRAWCYPLKHGPGTVGVTFVADNANPIIPGPDLVLAVQNHIDGKAPVTAAVTVFAPTALRVDVKVKIVPDTAAVRQAVKAELEDLFVREGEPGVTLLLSHIEEAISIATGETDHVLVSPSANIVPGAGVIPVIGAVIFETA